VKPHVRTENYPQTLAVDPSGKFLYVANLSNSSTGYRIDLNGVLSNVVLKPLPRSPFHEAGGPATIVADPAGKFVYVTNPNNNTISAHGIKSNGTLKPVLNSPFAAGSTPYAAGVDPAGKFLYVTNFGGATMSGYNIGSNGVITAISGSPFPTGRLPSSLAITSE
jgi:DNA-binding beta-propeller fold protein YncE